MPPFNFVCSFVRQLSRPLWGDARHAAGDRSARSACGDDQLAGHPPADPIELGLNRGQRLRKCPSFVVSRSEQTRSTVWEFQLRFVGVMRTTSKLNIVGNRLTADGVGHDVMEFEKAGLAASSAAADVRASAAVTSPHLSSHRRGNMTRRPGRWARRSWAFNVPLIIADGESSRLRQRRAVAADLFLVRSVSSSVSARSKIAARSPFGITCRIRSCTCRSLSCVARLIVN